MEHACLRRAAFDCCPLKLMGEHNVAPEFSEQDLQLYTHALLADLRALQFMIENDRFEQDVRRIGAEQELFLIDRNLHPAPVAVAVLDHAKDPRLTTEIARFNLEANLSPQLLT